MGARQWLERAKESTTPAQDVAEFKAFVATVAEAAKQKKLSEDIQLDALEMVRRSERALGVAIRQGQDVGAIRKYGTNPNRAATGAFVSATTSASTTDAEAMQSAEYFFTSGQAKSDTYAMTDVPDEVFEEAVTTAKEEGNLSRANVVSKVESLSSYRNEHAEMSDVETPQKMIRRTHRRFRRLMVMARRSSTSVRSTIGKTPARTEQVAEFTRPSLMGVTR